jgi:integrase
MTVKVKPYPNDQNRWWVEIRFRWPEDRTLYRERRIAQVTSKSGALRWGEAAERTLICAGKAALTPPPPAKEVPTLKDFAPRFISEHARANRHKASGIHTKERIFALHLLPALGAKRLDEITDAEVQAFKTRESIQKLGRKSLNCIMTVLSSALNVARSWGIISTVPTIKMVKAESPPAPFYDFDQYAKLVEAARAAGSKYLLAVLLGGDAGLRRGEMLAIRKADVDLVRGQLHVRRSSWNGIEDLPKGGRSRSVTLTKELAKALQHAASPRVLGEINENEIQLWIERLTAAAGLPVTRSLHILRHTFCSHLAMHGAPTRAIQVAAGHASITTTELYMHLSPSAEEGAIRLLDDARQRGKGGAKVPASPLN